MLLFVVLLSLSALALAQNHEMPKSAAPKSDSQTSFETIKTLAGDWEGRVTLDPPQPQWNSDKPLHIRMRVTSRGNAVVHELQESGTPLDPSKYDHPVTMLYLDSDKLTLIHYCDAGNRPRMIARNSPDGKTIEFDFVDIAGSTQYGHMHHAVFTAIDTNHHAEDWTFVLPGDKPVRAHFDLHRVNAAGDHSAKVW